MPHPWRTPALLCVYNEMFLSRALCFVFVVRLSHRVHITFHFDFACAILCSYPLKACSQALTMLEDLIGSETLPVAPGRGRFSINIPQGYECLVGGVAAIEQLGVKLVSPKKGCLYLLYVRGGILAWVQGGRGTRKGFLSPHKHSLSSQYNTLYLKLRVEIEQAVADLNMSSSNFDARSCVARRIHVCRICCCN